VRIRLLNVFVFSLALTLLAALASVLRGPRAVSPAPLADSLYANGANHAGWDRAALSYDAPKR